jgi:hypothetical protein
MNGDSRNLVQGKLRRKDRSCFFALMIAKQSFLSITDKLDETYYNIVQFPHDCSLEQSFNWLKTNAVFLLDSSKI